MFYKHKPKLSKFEKMLGFKVVETDMVRYIHIPNSYQLLNDMLNKKKKITSCDVE